MKFQRGGFTLVEQLVVLSVVLALVSVGFHVHRNIRTRTDAMRCVVNLNRLGTAMRLYAADNDGRFPQSVHQRKPWTVAVGPYLSSTNLLRAPGDPHPARAVSYAVNDYLTESPAGARDLDYSRVARITRPGETMHLAMCQLTYEGSDHFHFAGERLNELTFQSQVLVKAYRDAAGYLFADGHAELLPWNEVRQRIRRSDSRLVNPGGPNP